MVEMGVAGGEEGGAERDGGEEEKGDLERSRSVERKRKRKWRKIEIERRPLL